MTTNILSAILRFAKNPIEDLKEYSKSNNRANSSGDALERYIQDLFADTLESSSEDQRNESISEAFSYLGNQNNPPDLVIKNGDAIEIKKIESPNSGLALNSSYPKDKLYSDDTRISASCKNCEQQWVKKDIIYCVGYVKKNKIKHIWFVYGDCYAADKAVYTRIANGISTGILSIPDIEFSETNELGRVNKVDPLGITALRIRGMWHIDNPTSVYKGIYQPPESIGLACIMKKEKYTSFDKVIRLSIEDFLNKKDVKIKNPNNPAELLDAVLIQLKK